jgi:uncharacterized protein (DUF1330 family)
MAAYLIAEIDVVDGASYDEYRKQVPAVIAKYGGKFLVRVSTGRSSNCARRRRRGS